MTRSSLPLLAIAGLVALLGSGCPETLQQTCPSGSTSSGTFQLEFQTVEAADTCRVILTPDGGPADAAVTQTPARTAALLCHSPQDGGSILLSISGQQVRRSGLDGGAFAFETDAGNVVGTQCNCPIDINESLSGTLLGKDGGPAAVGEDGKLEPVGSIDAKLIDNVTAFDAGATDAGACRCNLPCTLQYTVTGTPI